VVGKVTKVEMIFFRAVEGGELGDTERMACSGGADSMLWFWLQRGGDRMKRC
jgi:hypothetical protein